MRSIILAASIGALLTLSACGQRGPLYLPKRPPKPPDAASVNARDAERAKPAADADATGGKERNPTTRQNDGLSAPDPKAGTAGTQTRQ